MAQSSAYDAVPYRSAAFTATDVNRIAAIGRLFGLETAHPNSCRVLELGCGEAGNLLAMAVSLPGSQFLGIDLSASAIERGEATAVAAGIENVVLRQDDIATLGPEIGEFDYVIAHGVYSWVRPEVRAALLRLIRTQLQPNGLAYVSYNALPGDQVRGAVRSVLRLHTASIDGPAEKIAAARTLLAALNEVEGDAAEVYRPLLQSEIGRMMRDSDEVLFHDDLAEVNEAFFLRDFATRAAEAGLQFVAESAFSELDPAKDLPAALAQLMGDDADLLTREQYRDFAGARRFRKSLVCHADRRIERPLTPGRLAGLRFSCQLERLSSPSGSADYRAPDGTALRTDDPLTEAVLDGLMSVSPASMSLRELVEWTGAPGAEEAGMVADSVLQCLVNGLVEARVCEPPVSPSSTARPKTSRLARVTASNGSVANFYHQMVKVDEAGQKLIPLLDGTRDAAALARETGLPAQHVILLLELFARRGLLMREGGAG